VVRIKGKFLTLRHQDKEEMTFCTCHLSMSDCAEGAKTPIQRNKRALIVMDDTLPESVWMVTIRTGSEWQNREETLFRHEDKAREYARKMIRNETRFDSIQRSTLVLQIEHFGAGFLNCVSQTVPFVQVLKKSIDIAPLPTPREKLACFDVDVTKLIEEGRQQMRDKAASMKQEWESAIMSGKHVMPDDVPSNVTLCTPNSDYMTVPHE
jgi:hypothetical protein